MTLHSGLLLTLTLAVSSSVLAAPDTPGAESAILERPDVKWRVGPVKYLLTHDEDAQFRKLKTDEERKAFIDQFWSRRDPSPGTPVNEFRDLFAKRLAIVEQRFRGRGTSGYEDDRGKTVLLLGAPDKVEMHEVEAPEGAAPPGPPGSGAVGGDLSGPRRKATFFYEKAVLPGGAAQVKLEFSEEPSGLFRLASKFDFSDPRLTGVEALPLPAPPPVAAAPPAAPPPEAPAAAAPPPPPTPQSALMDEVLSGPTPTSRISVAARLDCVKTAESETLALLTVALKKRAQGDAPPILAARLTGPGDTIALRLEKEDSFAPAAENSTVPVGADLLYQAQHDVAPGKYSLVAAVKDPNSGDTGFVLQNVEVPDFHDSSVRLSSVTLARKVERLAAPAAPGARFVLNNSKVLPAPRPSFKAGEDVWLYFQIYNTANDPVSGGPKLKVSYRFEKVEKTGARLLGGRPIEQTATSNVQAYSVTVQAAWPAGDYRVVLKVDDLTAGSSATDTIPFVVVK